MYNDGCGVPKDFERAASYYEKAAELGNSLGQLFLAEYYLNSTGILQDKAKAKYWLEKSAEQGCQKGSDLLKRNSG